MPSFSRFSWLALFIRDLHAARGSARRPVISLEFFPPKTPEGECALLEKTLPELLRLVPDYCSVTYGAAGSTRDKTLALADRIQREHGLTAMAHLTCVNATREQTREVIEQARRLGIKNLLALRGDPPAGTAGFEHTPGGFQFSHELVTFLREQGGFSVGTAGFPEGHMMCKEGKHVDWQRLKAKIDCGADFVLTQLFYDNRDFFEFRDYLSRLGVTVPVCPGVLPILGTAQIKRFSALSGATLPPSLLTRLEQLGDDEKAVTEFGIEFATSQCSELIRGGVPGLHFFTLNKAASTSRILRNLGLAPG